LADLILNALRSANPTNSRFFFTVSELRKKTGISGYRALIQKIKRVRPLGSNTLIQPKQAHISKISRMVSLAALPFENEIAWTAVQISDNAGKLQFHLECVESLSDYIARGDFIRSLDVLDSHIDYYGETLWAIEAKIGVLSRKDFSSAGVNEYLSSRVEVYGSVADYLAYLFSDLYDEDTSLGGFHRRIGARLKTFNRQDLKNFLNVKAMSFETITCDALGDFVRINSVFSLIDAYEAVIKSIPQYFFCDHRLKSNTTLLAALLPLQQLEDTRLAQICNTLAYSLRFGESIASDAILTVECPKSFPDFKKISIMALCSREHAERVGVDSSGFSGIERQFAEILLSFKDRKKELISTYDELQTFASKYYFLPWFPTAKSWIDGLFLPFSGELNYLFYRASTSFDSAQYVNLESMVRCLPWMPVYEPSGEDHGIYLGNSLRLLSGSQPQIEESRSPIGDVLRYGNQLLVLTAALNDKNEKKLLKACVELAITNVGSATFLPFSFIFDGKESWDDLIEFDSLDLVIGLYFASLWDRESRLRFLLEFACKKMLSSGPDDILVSVAEGDPRTLFILREIMVPKNLRLVGALRTVEDLEKFRIDVCAAMLDVDKEYSDRYVAETMEILQAQEMRKAESELESARIYVDKEGVKQWAEKTYREEFLRAKKARTTKMAPSIEEIEKNFTENVYSAENKENSSLAHNLKDPIFSIASEIFTKCFWKEDDGLDHFLSLRIRHGSFAGYLRAPLEQSQLIGTGSPTTGATRVYWEEYLSRSSPQSIASVLSALEKFQFAFDAIVEHFRTDLLQIATKEKPHGLFVPGLHRALWDAYHSDWEGAQNFDKFFDFIWDAFQEALSSSLTVVMASIDTKVLTGSEELLRVLRKTVNESGLDDSDRANVISALNEGARSLQEAVKAVKKWFEVKRDPVGDTTLTIKQILELALKLFKKIRPNFELSFTPEFQSHYVVFSGANISRVTDALFIIFDNIYKHSGFSDTAEISLKFNWIEDSVSTGFVNLEVCSPIHETKDIEEIRTKLARVRATMNSDENRVALVNEGLSGLIKLSWLAEKGRHGGYVDFSVAEEGFFRVSLSMGFGFKPF